jgi:hypothetical protein
MNRVVDVGGSERKGERDSPERKDVFVKAYSDADGKLYQPAVMIHRAMIRAASSYKMPGGGRKAITPLIAGAIAFEPEAIPHLNQNWVVDSRTVVVPATKGRINRHRPRLDKWELRFEMKLMDDRLQPGMVQRILEDAGRLVGIGDYRPEKTGPYGRFRVAEFKSL